MAWNTACKESNGPTKLLVPQGKFFAGDVQLEGPCKFPMIIEIQGTILSDPKTDTFRDGKECFMFKDVDNLEVNGGGTFDGQGQQAWENGKNGLMPVSMKFHTIRNGKVRDLNLVNSKGFQMTITSCTNFVAENLKITAPDSSPRTDGIHISRSNGVQVLNSFIGTGDDCISIGDGSTGVTVSGITCGPGHGISIGSLGKPLEQSVKGVLVTRSTLSNTQNGVRIKTFQNSPRIEASDITFEDITMNDVRNPILIDQNYRSESKAGASLVKISNVHFRNIRGTSVSSIAVALNCSPAVPCEGIELANIDLTLSPKAKINFPLSATCRNVRPPAFIGTQNPPPCR